VSAKRNRATGVSKDLKSFQRRRSIWSVVRFFGGVATAGLGVAIHFAIAGVFAAVYYAASLRVEALRTHAVPFGIAYGAVIWVLMDLVVLPLSAVPKAAFDPLVFTAFCSTTLSSSVCPSRSRLSGMPANKPASIATGIVQSVNVSAVRSVEIDSYAVNTSIFKVPVVDRVRCGRQSSRRRSGRSQRARRHRPRSICVCR
jgi:hypothetical protein